MSDTTTPTPEVFNPNAQPYKIDMGSYNHAPVPELQILMCDLAIKHPSISFKAVGRTYTMGQPLVDELDVFNGTEKVGRAWVVREFDRRDGKHVMVYNISSPRISNARGSRNRKYSKHYGTIMKTAAEVFSEVPAKDVAHEIIENAGYRVRTLGQSAHSQLTYMVRGYEVELLEYLTSVKDNGPSPIPPELLSKLGNWRDKQDNHRIADGIRTSFESGDGLIVKLTPKGEMVGVDLTNVNEIKRFSSTYDLPVEYQDKITILKIAELNQPIAGIGAKVEYDNSTFFYMPSGAIQTTC